MGLYIGLRTNNKQHDTAQEEKGVQCSYSTGETFEVLSGITMSQGEGEERFMDGEIDGHSLHAGIERARLIPGNPEELQRCLRELERRCREVDPDDFVPPEVGEPLQLLEQYMGRSWADFDRSILTRLRALAVYAIAHNLKVCWS